jgi:hypothetical protein
MKIKLFKWLSTCLILSIFSINTYTITLNNNSTPSMLNTAHLSKFKPAGDPPW